MTTGDTSGDLYSWDVRCGDALRAGPGGISTDRDRAVEALTDALSAEGTDASGAVWVVRLSAGPGTGYAYDGLVAKGTFEARSGTVTIDIAPLSA